MNVFSLENKRFSQSSSIELQRHRDDENEMCCFLADEAATAYSGSMVLCSNWEVLH
jgi:hypothetical protein